MGKYSLMDHTMYDNGIEVGIDIIVDTIIDINNNNNLYNEWFENMD
jgi:hypothetical protein